MKRTMLAAVAALLGGASVQAVEVEFAQLNWLDEEGNVMIPASQVGEATFRFDPANPDDQQLLEWGGGGGFVNLVVASTPDGPFEWVVQNLYLSYPDENYMIGSAPTLQFRVPVADQDWWVDSFFDVYVTLDPMFDPPPPTPTHAPVRVYDYHVGGLFGGGSGLSDWPFIVGPWVGPLVFPPFQTDETWIPGQFLAPIDEGTNGCAPASCARSIDYLGFVHGFPTDPAQDIYGGLYGEMGTTSGGGTSDPDMLAGKRRYAAEHHLPICTELAYGFADWILYASMLLGQGADIEILISWTGGGGHAAMITSITVLPDGSAIITYVDDPTQGDGIAENKEHVIVVNPDGTFPGGRVDGFMIEVPCDPVPGDVDGDGDVDQADLGELLGAYGSVVGDPDYNRAADIDDDGDVDQSDLGTMLGNYGHGT